MTNLNNSSTLPLENKLVDTAPSQIPSHKKKFPSRLIIGILIFSSLGFIDATYLTAKHYQNQIPPCSIVQGCEVVLTSSYATILGIPVAVLGAVFYLAIVLVSIYALDTKWIKTLFLFPIFGIISMIATIWFLSLQFFIIRAVCQYCLISAVSSTGIFVLGGLILKKTSKNL